MFIVIGFMAFGVMAGYLLRKQAFMRHSGKAVTVLIWLLLFLFGLEVGSNERIIKGIHSLGLEALLLSVAGLVGSLLAAMALWKYIKRRGGVSQ